MSRVTENLDRGATALQRIWQTLTLTFCLGCVVLPLNMAGPFGAVALVEAEAQVGSEAYVACWGETFRQLTRRTLNRPIFTAVPMPESEPPTAVATSRDHVPLRGALRDLNGCGAMLLL